MAKTVAEECCRLSVFWLKKYSYLDGWSKGGAVQWNRGGGAWERNLGFFVDTNADKPCVRLFYTLTVPSSGEEISCDYNVSLTTTPCHYGGVRYWFICPLFKNGRYCGRRVGVLYSIGKYFGCRHCGDIAYATQMRGGRFRECSITFPKIEKLKQAVKRISHNGKPTRKFMRVLAAQDKIRRELARFFTVYSKY